MYYATTANDDVRQIMYRSLLLVIIIVPSHA